MGCFESSCGVAESEVVDVEVKPKDLGGPLSVVSEPSARNDMLARKSACERSQITEAGSQAEAQASAAPVGDSRTFEVTLHRRRGEKVGAVLGNSKSGAVIIGISEGGIVDQWNKSNPQSAVRPGFIVDEVNGQSGYWSIMEQMRKLGSLTVKVSHPPVDANPTWLEDIAEMAKIAEQGATKDSFILRLQPKGSNEACADKLSSLQCVRASDCGVDQCAICMEDVTPNQTLVRLPCKHAFHPHCVGRWLEQSINISDAKKHSCPLCCRKLVCTETGGACVAEQ